MGHTETASRSFRQKLRSELTQRGWGVRTLARTMADREGVPTRTESIRRQLKRYLSDSQPINPTVATRRSIEEALGLERDALQSDEDDEESDPVALFMKALLYRVDRRVDERIGKATSRPLT